MQRVSYGLVLVTGLLVLAFLIDLAPASHELPLTAIYITPILAAAHLLRPRAVLAVSAAGLLLHLLNLVIDEVPVAASALHTLVLLLAAYLGYKLCERTHETQLARDRLQRFLGMVAHDLRGPLTVVLSYSQMLNRGRDGLPSGLYDRATRAIEAEAHRMDRLVGDLLDAARIGAGSFTTGREDIDLVQVARQVAAVQQATTSRHRIALEAPPSLPGSWDADRIRQVLTNLVTNAIKYSAGGGDVLIRIAEVDGKAVTSVTDQGIGLAREDIALLFEPFSRLNREQAVGGIGLGLYIAKAIVEAHGGRIWAESPGPGKGSTFVFTLPISRGREQRQ